MSLEITQNHLTTAEAVEQEALNASQRNYLMQRVVYLQAQNQALAESMESRVSDLISQIQELEERIEVLESPTPE